MIFVIFILGAALYVAIELLWRGRSHWSMALAGGVCLVLLYGIRRALTLLPIAIRPPLQWLVFCFFGSFVITAVEFLIGCIVNLWLKLGVWDYSKKKLQLFGQVCLGYMGCWAILCVPAYYLLSFID